MTARRLQWVGLAAIVLLAAGIWLSVHRSNERADLGGSAVFVDLKAALADVNEIRLSRGDGALTTLRKDAGGWIVVERAYAADAQRVRALALGLAEMKIVERKTSDPANYPTLGVEAPEAPTAASTLVEVVAGSKTWSLIVGKNAEGRAIYVRKPKEAASALASPAVAVDPDQKRWVDRLIADIPGTDVREVSVKPASGPAYLLTRGQRGGPDVTLSPVPKGRTPLTSISLGAQADALAAFNFDDVHPLPSPTPVAADRATYRTFDGQAFELAGRRDGEKALLTVTARRDAAPEAKPAPDAVERLAARANGVEYEIPLYKYEAIFKPQADLLEPPKKP